MNQPTLTRKNHKVAESMQRYLSAIDNNLYAAEQVCYQESGGRMRCSECDFKKSCVFVATTLPYHFNKLRAMRNTIGNHIKQDDPTTDAYTGPCVWALGSGRVIFCGFKGRKGCPEMVMVDHIITCGRKMS